MKVEFYFPEDPIVGYNDINEIKEVNKTIKKKVHKKVIEIPCVPTEKMQVDISSFSHVFGFSKKEMSWIKDSNEQHYITDVFIKPTHLEVWLNYIKPS